MSTTRGGNYTAVVPPSRDADGNIVVAEGATSSTELGLALADVQAVDGDTGA